MNRYFWSFIIFGLAMPSIITSSYALKVMGVPWWVQFFTGIWIGVSALWLSDFLASKR